MFSAIPANLLMLSLVSTLTMGAACMAVGVVALKTAAKNSAARHPVAVADVLGRSGRVQLGIIAAGAIGIFIAWLADLGQHTKKSHEDADAE